MSKAQVEYTEDDTFEALCRIPVAELERRLEWKCLSIANAVRRKISHEAFIKKAENRPRWISAILGKPERVILSDVDLFLYSHFAEDFEGTGWTAHTYELHIRKLVQNKVSHNRDLDVKKFRHKMGVSLAVVAFVVLTAFAGLPYIIQLLAAVGAYGGGLLYLDFLDKKYNKQKDFDGLI